MNEPNSSEVPKPSETASCLSALFRAIVSVICVLAPMLVFHKSIGSPQIKIIIICHCIFILLSGNADYCITHPRGQRNTLDCIFHMMCFIVVMTIITIVAGIGACFANLRI
jgi:hypothetical protein